MTAITASAPGKAILFGEHAVVYGQPAIAVPIFDVRAKAIIKADIQAPEGRIWIRSEGIDLDAGMATLAEDDPLNLTVSNTLAHFGVERVPAFQLKIDSNIPVAAGMGSGAAVSAAIARAVAGFLGQKLEDAEVSAIAFESEKYHHGTPSGIDNTVVSYEQAVYFEKGSPIELLEFGQPLSLLVADTGMRSNTRKVVDQVREAWKKSPEKLEGIFQRIGDISENARKALRLGNFEQLGELMNANQQLLNDMAVSSPELDGLIENARKAGAWGAKLSGGGKGGNMIVLAEKGIENLIEQALIEAGAVSVIRSRIT